jgi:hypothetical protein
VTNDLKSILDKTKKYKEEEMKGGSGKHGKLVRKMSLSINIMMPVKPMLARYV